MSPREPVIDPRHVPEDLQGIITALCSVAGTLAHTIALGPLGGALGQAVGHNSDGDAQKALDVLADDAFRTALGREDLRWYASEEQDDVLPMTPSGRFAVAIDPLDGSSNIDVNTAIGTIFSIYWARDDATDSFLRPAHEQIAAGYFIYGPQTALILSFGHGVLSFVLDPNSRVFRLVTQDLQVPATAAEFAINASNYRHWSPPIRAYIDDCLAGDDGPRERNFNMRWVASLVAETHRILTRGGIFLYPADKRDGYQNGRLRLVYEAAPIAFLLEQAGGKATDGADRIMDRQADSLHARTPLVFGSAEKVDRVTAYHDMPDTEISALFGRRGLFRA
ncbi:MAG: class 1 fructose-bisphosphatase [Rhodobacteraceae bacterium]|nr:class 1 fructose-bisphosphatase [Paracoccaceae bacterium]